MPREAPAWWYDDSGPWPRRLAPLARLYGALVEARFAWTRPERAAVPVICIGNPTAGGAGKTPTAIATAGLLQGLGARPAFLSRGYGGRVRAPHAVDPERDTAAQVGDEPLLLARTAPTIIAADRRAGARRAVAEGAGVLVMDDGFQNPQLAKDLSILVVDAAAGVGNGRVLPAGPLRARLDFQLDRADALMLVGKGTAAEPLVEAMARRGRPVFRGALTPVGAAAALRGARCLAFAGIARPEKFFATLEALGAEIVERRPFPDHHRYRESEAEALLQAAEAAGAELVTTEKDLVRLGQGGAALERLAARAKPLPVILQLEQPGAYAAFLKTVLEG